MRVWWLSCFPWPEVPQFKWCSRYPILHLDWNTHFHFSSPSLLVVVSGSMSAQLTLGGSQNSSDQNQDPNPDREADIINEEERLHLLNEAITWDTWPGDDGMLGTLVVVPHQTETPSSLRPPSLLRCQCGQSCFSLSSDLASNVVNGVSVVCYCSSSCCSLSDWTMDVTFLSLCLLCAGVLCHSQRCQNKVKSI